MTSSNSILGDTTTPVADVITYSHEQLVEMRKCGLPKPEVVPQAAWDLATPLRAKPTQQLLEEHLEAYPVQQGDKSAYGILARDAFVTMHEIMQDKNESGRTRAQVAQFIAEQATGKAGQTITHQGNFALEIIQQTNKLVEAGYRDVTNSTPDATTAITKDAGDQAVEDFLKTHAVKEFSVGKRSDGQSK